MIPIVLKVYSPGFRSLYRLTIEDNVFQDDYDIDSRILK